MRPRAQLSPTQPGLSTELKERIDGPDATNSTNARATVASINAANLSRLKGIVAEFGFPTLAMVGPEGANAAWLLTQHADDDPAFQKHVLTLIEAGAKGRAALQA
jgi:hypothetical protein